MIVLVASRPMKVSSSIGFLGRCIQPQLEQVQPARPERVAVDISPFDGQFAKDAVPTIAPMNSGWSTSCRMGFAPTENQHLSRRTTTSKNVSERFVSVHPRWFFA